MIAATTTLSTSRSNERRRSPTGPSRSRRTGSSSSPAPAPAVDQAFVDRARQLAGLKGYVTNNPAIRLTGNEIVAAYHELFQVERSFRTAKTDLRARPMFHHEADSIHAHLTIVFTALAISSHLQDLTGATIRKIIRTLRPQRDVTISINGNEITATTPPGSEARAILTAAAGH